jgi:hypothetical protein
LALCHFVDPEPVRRRCGYVLGHPFRKLPPNCTDCRDQCRQEWLGNAKRNGKQAKRHRYRAWNIKPYALGRASRWHHAQLITPTSIPPAIAPTVKPAESSDPFRPNTQHAVFRSFVDEGSDQQRQRCRRRHRAGHPLGAREAKSGVGPVETLPSSDAAARSERPIKKMRRRP